MAVFQSGAAEHEVWAPDVFGRYFSFISGVVGYCHSVSDTALCEAGSLYL